MATLRGEIERRGLVLPIGVDGGVNADTIGPARRAGGSVMVAGSALYRHPGDLAPVVDDLRRAALADG
jgi:ribulose-phosphate 3-epimerase